MRVSSMKIVRCEAIEGGYSMDADPYPPYFEKVKHRFPPGALAFASAEGRYDINDRRCLHDAWVESFHVIEGNDDCGDRRRGIRIEARLLGPYHDRYVNLSYADVQRFSVDVRRFQQMDCYRAFGDLLIDEVRLGRRGLVVHEAQFTNGRWVIECADISHEWEIILGADAS